MTHISSSYGNLFGSKVKPATTPAAPQLSTSSPETPRDTISLSPQAQSPLASGQVTAADMEQVRQELTKLRTQLATINQEIEGLMKQLDGQGAPAAASTPAAPQAQGTTYAVKGGDYLWKIAKEQLGDASRWKEIYELNKDTIGDNPNLLKPGQSLKLPARKDPVPPLGTTVPPQATPQPTPQPATPPTPTPTAPVPPAQTTPAPVLPVPQPPVVPTSPAPTPPVPAPVLPTPATPAAGTRNLSDQDVARIAQNFGLAADRANVTAFLDEMDSYQGSMKGKVFGPGMESLAATPEESGRFRQSVQQIQQAFNLLIKAGKLKPILPNGQPVQQLPESGTFFKVDAQGKEVRDAQGNPQMDEAFIAAITQFKQERQVHQNYRLADGSYGINEYVGPTTIDQLKQALTALQS